MSSPVRSCPPASVLIVPASSDRPQPSAGRTIQPAPDCERVSTSAHRCPYMVRRPHARHVQPPEISQLRIIARRPRRRSPRTSPRVRGRLYNIILSSMAQVTHHDTSDRPAAAAFLPIHSPHASAKSPDEGKPRRGECVRCRPGLRHLAADVAGACPVCSAGQIAQQQQRRRECARPLPCSV